MRRFLLGPFLFVCACATTPAAPPPPATPKTSPVGEPQAGDEAASVAVDLTELTLRVEEDGSITRTLHEVFRLRSAEPDGGWSHVFAFWKPWLDDEPRLEATVVAPDGTLHKLDQKTISDQAHRNDDGMLTDEKLRLAPLPALALGAVVERTTVTRRKPLFVKGASLGLSFEPMAPEKKRVFVVDLPAGAPLHLERVDTELEPTRTEKDGRVILRYERGPASPRGRPEPWAPPEPRPLVLISTVASWQAAAQAWTEKAEPQIDVAAVKTLAASVTAGQTTREGKIEALRAWLRGNVRYTGLELDDAAWVPRRSAEVVERKYGDCKDLSVLLTAMLRAVGVPADPALLDAGFGLDSSPGAPGLTGFNHAIVRVSGGPPLWIDPTAPWTALGELPPGVGGRLALVARADTTALTKVTSTAGSRLDTRVEWFFAPSGPARSVRTRTSEGWLFREGREVAARSKDEYRKNLERWAKERQETSGAIKVDISEPAGAGPFREELDLPDTSWGETTPNAAEAVVQQDSAFAAVRALNQLEKSLPDRQQPIVLSNSAHARVVNVFHPPVGYRLKELPAAVKDSVGPLSAALTWKAGQGDDVEATLEVDFAGGDVSPDDARRFVEEVYPRFNAQIRFPNSVLSAIEAGRYHAAALEAEALLAKHPTPVWRSMLAYALASAGLQSDAEAEGRRAVAEAPKNPLVRNRLAYVLLHNDQGIDFGPGFKRAELLKLLDETLTLAPDDEWARRMHVLVLSQDERGEFVRDPKLMAKLDAEIAEYREKTKSTQLDDEAIDLMLRQKAWTRLLTELPKFPQTAQRDAAWLAAELVLQGDPEAALRKAATEKRLSEKTSELATQYVLLAREYQTVERIFAFAERALQQDRRGEAGIDEVTRLMRTLKKQPAPAAGTVEATWLKLTTLLLSGAPQTELKEVVGGELSEEEAAEVKRVMQALMKELPRGGADPMGFAQDFTLTSGVFQQRPLPGFGELVTLRFKVRSVSAPTTMLMTRGRAGYVARFDLGPDLAAKSIELLQQKKEAEARELLHALVAITPDAPRPLKEERAEVEQAGFAWAALTAIKKPGHEQVLSWLETQLFEPELDELAFRLSLEALSKGWKDAPEKRLALGKKLAQANSPQRRDAGLYLSVTALRGLGRYREALALLDEGLAKAPRDRRLREYKAYVLPELGQFAESRALNRQLASEVEPDRAAGYLNDSAWWALFGEVDDEAVQEIQRARQISSSPNFVNTAACVYAAAGKYDSAAQEIQRMVRAASDKKEQDLHASYWYAKGLLAEGFGRPETAKALFKKAEKSKPSSPADVWNLAQRRLEKLRK